MNIMYVSVTERTREIGLRMSIGAKGRDILAQFLIEAILISVTGGLIGVVFGIGASWVVKLVAGWPVYVQLYSVVLSFVVCTVTGIFFGWYPAQKASNLDPIEAIRYGVGFNLPVDPVNKQINLYLCNMSDKNKILKFLIQVSGWGLVFGFSPFLYVERG